MCHTESETSRRRRPKRWRDINNAEKYFRLGALYKHNGKVISSFGVISDLTIQTIDVSLDKLNIVSASYQLKTTKSFRLTSQWTSLDPGSLTLYLRV